MTSPLLMRQKMVRSKPKCFKSARWYKRIFDSMHTWSFVGDKIYSSYIKIIDNHEAFV